MQRQLTHSQKVLEGLAVNDFGKIGYGGPCPPPGSTHRYRFRLYALSAPLDLEPGARLDTVLKAIQRQKTIAVVELTTSYGR